MNLFLKNFIKNRISYYLLVTIILIVKSDIPVHCPADKIAGRWKFRLYGGFFKPSILDNRTTCDHGYPGKILKFEEKDQNIPNTDIMEQFELELRLDFNVYISNQKVGTWTNVYDQGFLVYYQDFVITAQSKYYLKDDTGINFESDCNKTMKGWVTVNLDEKTSSFTMSCFVAEKIITDTKSKKINRFLTEDKIASRKGKDDLIFKNIMKRDKSKEAFNTKKLLKNIKMSDMQEVIDEINNSKLTWKAKIIPEFLDKTLYDYFKYLHFNFGGFLDSEVKNNNFEQEESKENENDEQIKKRAKSFVKEQLRILREEKEIKEKMELIEEENIKSNYNEDEKNDSLREKDSQFITDPEEILKYINTPLNEIEENLLPKNWDWRDVGGENYYSEENRQGRCGSCFTIATISILESRLRIKTLNKDQTKFSIQFPLSCSFYNEGCNGGFPIMVGKFLHEFEIVPKECLEYKENDEDCQNLCNYHNNKNKYMVSDYGYIGGYYGASNEVLMMKELRARGPITGNFLSPPGFTFFKEGIFSMGEIKNNTGNLNYTTLNDKGLFFEELSHSVTILGYGEENGTKYWLCMNSWGTQWGNNGYFKILRGEDEQGIESMAEYFNIEVIERKS